MVTDAISITHEHLLSIINTEFHRFIKGTIIRLLDTGCGDGQLIAYLVKNLPSLNPSLKSEVYGFDVEDHGVQTHGFLSETIARLAIEAPSIYWPDRIISFSAGEKWPYPNKFFDIIFSNQVLEHINDHELVFSKIYRTLRDGGVSVHLFPLKHYVYERHLNLPLVHRIASYDILFSYIKLMSRIRVGKFKIHKRESNATLGKYAREHADYIHYYTNYISYKEALLLAKKCHMGVSVKYTRELYFRKIKSILKLKTTYTYRDKRSSLADWLSVLLLKYLSSVTLFLEKEDTYRRP